MSLEECAQSCTKSVSCFDVKSHELPSSGSELAEKYVFLIAELAEEDGKVKPIELTKRLQVNAATVTRNLRRLEEAGLVSVERHRGARLTEAGQSLAETMRYRQDTVAKFLLAYGVKPCTAQIDAVRLMSELSPETLRVFATLLAERMAFKDREHCSVRSCSCQSGDCMQSRIRAGG